MSKPPSTANRSSAKPWMQACSDNFLSLTRPSSYAPVTAQPWTLPSTPPIRTRRPRRRPSSSPGNVDYLQFALYHLRERARGEGIVPPRLAWLREEHRRLGGDGAAAAGKRFPPRTRRCVGRRRYRQHVWLHRVGKTRIDRYAAATGFRKAQRSEVNRNRLPGRALPNRAGRRAPADRRLSRRAQLVSPAARGLAAGRSARSRHVNEARGAGTRGRA